MARARFVLDVGRRGVYNGGNSDVVHNVLTHCEESLMTDNHLPADAAWLFPEYDFDTMHLESHKSVVIERVLERGT